jgi:tetrahydromethanopterin S-methyltransferase subunit E
VSGAFNEKPGANVVFVRSLFYGVAAGGAFGVAVGLASTRSIYSVPVAGGWGAFIGAATGLVLGLCLGLIRPKVSVLLRVLVASLAMLCVYLGLSLLLQGFPLHPGILLLVVPPGLAAWFLLPVVLRPEARGEMPRLPGQST